jgi:hypothetical protein
MPREKSVSAENLTEGLLREHPVWEFCNDDAGGETLVRPVKKLPISSSDGRLVGCELYLNDGSVVYGLLGNLSLTKPKRNQHFLTLTVFVDGVSVHLARYFDADYSRRGPAMLAAKLRKRESEVFPISYDLSAIASGSPECVRGSVPQEPQAQLSRSEIIQLAVRR